MLWVFALILWPVAELFVAIKVADAIGVLLTLLLIVASWPIGTWVLRSRGRTAMRRLSLALSEGRAPGNEVIDGALGLSGGVALMIPGFITDAIGTLLLLPPTRAVARAVIARNLRNRLLVRAVSFGAGPRHYDVDSTAVDAEPPSIDRRPPQLPA